MEIEYYVSIVVHLVLILIFSLFAYKLGIKAARESSEGLGILCLLFLIGVAYITVFLLATVSSPANIKESVPVNVVQESIQESPEIIMQD